MFKQNKVKSKINIREMIKASSYKLSKIKIEKVGTTLIIQDNGISILDVLLFNTETVISELYITTFRLGKKDIDTLVQLNESGFVKNITLLISDSIRAMTKGAFNHLIDSGIRFKELNTHTKMMFIKKTNGECVNCFSSGNFNPDGKIEQVSFNYDKEEFNHYSKWIEKI